MFSLLLACTVIIGYYLTGIVVIINFAQKSSNQEALDETFNRHSPIKDHSNSHIKR